MSEQPRDLPPQDFVQLRPTARDFDPAPYREWTRVAIVVVFLILVVTIVVGSGIAFLSGHLKEETLLTIISGFIGLFSAVIGFYFGQEAARR